MDTSESYSVPALLPCPFCGSPAELAQVPEDADIKSLWWRIDCRKESCPMYAAPFGYERRGDVIKAWNTRAAELTASSVGVRQEGLTAQQGWKPIESAPKDGTYILIAECGLLPDIAAWCRELPERIDSHGTKYLARPEGWFDVSRSRLHPTHWQPLPEPPHEDL